MAHDLERSFTHSNPPPESGVVRAYAWQFPDGSLHRRAMSSIHNLELVAVPVGAKAVPVRIITEERYQESVPLAELESWLKEVEDECDGDGDTRYASFVEEMRREASRKWSGTEEEAS